MFLTELNRSLWQNHENPFGHYNKQHFARWVVVDDQLVYAAAVDGSAEDYLTGLANHCTDLLAEIYCHCENFPESEVPAPESIGNYLLAHQEATQMFYHGLRNRTVAEIQTESQIYRSIQTFLDGNQDSNEFKAQTADSILGTIKAHLKGTGIRFFSDRAHFFNRIPPSLKRKLWWRLPALVAVVLTALGLIPVILFMEWRERRQPSGLSPFVENQQAKALDFEETLAIQSPMTSVVAIKPGWLRSTTLRLTLWAIQVLADHLYNKGKLGSISSIHFARWAIINHGKHLLFISNYDGSWESYLGDFIDRAALGLTAVWGNAVGFPPSHLLVLGGASHAFKTYAKNSQVVTQFWYSAYPNLSMPNKLNNSAIRAKLMDQSKDSASRWLQRF